MGQININIQMDEALKQDFDRLCNELGFNMSTAFNIFAKTVVRRHGIPFDVALFNPNQETAAAIEEVRQMKMNPSLGKSYTDVDEMMKDILG